MGIGGGAAGPLEAVAGAGGRRTEEVDERGGNGARSVGGSSLLDADFEAKL